MAIINVRVDEDLKKQANDLFTSLGLDMSTAVNIFLRQSVMRDGIPFEIVRPNQETLAAIAELNEMKAHPEKYKRYKNLDDMWTDLAE